MTEPTPKLLSFYDKHIDEHGSGPRAVGWGSAGSQRVRFKELCEIGDVSNSSMLDVGCGLGDLYEYLAGRYNGVEYAGIDINPRYVKRAREAHPEAHFEVADFGTYEGKKFDYILASGAFSVKIQNYKEVYFKHIEKMFAMARKGVAFNILDKEHHPDDESYAAYSVAEVRNFCLSLTDNVVIRHDYLPHDFTVLLGKRFI